MSYLCLEIREAQKANGLVCDMNRDSKKYFTEMILPHSSKMYGVALAITGSREDASDAVQTAMLRIWKSVSEGLVPENPTAYCISAVRNVCINESMRAKRLSPLEGNAELPSEGIAAEASLRLQEVTAGLTRLPDKERQAVELTAYAGCSSEELANALNVSPANARQLLSRGRRKLREWFK